MYYLVWNSIKLNFYIGFYFNYLFLFIKLLFSICMLFYFFFNYVGIIKKYIILKIEYICSIINCVIVIFNVFIIYLKL